jgi:hypothetical protein
MFCEDHGEQTVTDQSSAEPSESQARSRPHSMDGDHIRLRNGLPSWFRLLAMLAFPALAIAAWFIVRNTQSCYSYGASASTRSSTMTRANIDLLKHMPWFAKSRSCVQLSFR